MFTCICAAATESEVRDCVHTGARSVDEIGDACGAGTGCGSCVDKLGALLLSVAPPRLERSPASA
ncbi:MAG: (2Fe-2S)-binding protein [Actinomycetota bacterium]|nr:(2Fe-2S)-binding protein [Actinomycetota bacterium]